MTSVNEADEPVGLVDLYLAHIVHSCRSESHVKLLASTVMLTRDKVAV